jgi:hypothetical protein
VTRTATNGSTPSRFDVEGPEAVTGGVRWPEVTVGLFLVAAFALAGAWLYSGATTESAVVAARVDLVRGDVVTAEHLQVVEIATDDPVNVVFRDGAAGVIGQVALSDISAGSLITADQFAPAVALAPGIGIVGLSLSAGQYPSVSLAPGDTVRVVRHPDRDDAEIPVAAVLVAHAEVLDVAWPGNQGQILISLAMDTAEADIVAAGAAENRISLIQVAAEDG